MISSGSNSLHDSTKDNNNIRGGPWIQFILIAIDIMLFADEFILEGAKSLILKNDN